MVVVSCRRGIRFFHSVYMSKSPLLYLCNSLSVLFWESFHNIIIILLIFFNDSFVTLEKEPFLLMFLFPNYFCCLLCFSLFKVSNICLVYLVRLRQFVLMLFIVLDFERAFFYALRWKNLTILSF